MRTELEELSFSELADELAGDILQTLIRGELRSGVYRAMTVTLEWKRLQDVQSAAKARHDAERGVPVAREKLAEALRTIAGMTGTGMGEGLTWQQGFTRCVDIARAALYLV